MKNKIKIILLFFIVIIVIISIIVYLNIKANNKKNDVEINNTVSDTIIDRTDEPMVVELGNNVKTSENPKTDEENSKNKEESKNTQPLDAATLTQNIYNMNSEIGTLYIPKTGLTTAIYSNSSVSQMEKMPCFLYTTGGLNKPGATLIVGHNKRNGKLERSRA